MKSIHGCFLFFHNRLGSTNSTNRSLTDIDAIEETLESWFVNDLLCVCTGNDGNGEVKCSANEQNTCVSPVDKPGDDVSIVVRQKRSGNVLDKEYKHRMRKMKERREAFRHSETVMFKHGITKIYQNVKMYTEGTN